jgi:hypothetical protein
VCTVDGVILILLTTRKKNNLHLPMDKIGKRSHLIQQGSKADREKKLKNWLFNRKASACPRTSEEKYIRTHVI